MNDSFYICCNQTVNKEKKKIWTNLYSIEVRIHEKTSKFYIPFCKESKIASSFWYDLRESQRFIVSRFGRRGKKKEEQSQLYLWRSYKDRKKSKNAIDGKLIILWYYNYIWYSTSGYQSQEEKTMTIDLRQNIISFSLFLLSLETTINIVYSVWLRHAIETHSLALRWTAASSVFSTNKEKKNLYAEQLMTMF